MHILLIAILIIIILAIIYLGALFRFIDRKSKPGTDGRLEDDTWRIDNNFLWGSATAAYQVEGNCTNNNWFQFESSTDEHGWPRILDHQEAGIACNHWQQYKEDIQLMKALSLNAYRFSVEWSKIEPKPGEFDEKALDHYRRVVDELLANNIEPMITLHHFTNPIWFEEQGAFLQKNSPDIFGRFVEHVITYLGREVNLWCTINEPSIYAVNGYFSGDFPPAVHEPQKAAIVLGNLLRSHTFAYRAIKSMEPRAQVGLVMAVILYDPPNRWNLLDVVTAYLLNKNLNESILEYLVKGNFRFSMPGIASDSFVSNLKECFDFTGLNYYTRFFRGFNPFGGRRFVEVAHSPPEKLTDMGWEIYPAGLYRALKLITRYTAKPIYITENGIADENDTKRGKYIEDHLQVLNKAVSDGMNIKGYFYWSLMDNFEWTYGRNRRFGLYHVDYSTQKRTLRDGSRKYLEMIRKSYER